jgi:hypothetical protein
VWWYHHWKVFLVPVFVTIITQVIYGVDWPIVWGQKLISLQIIKDIIEPYGITLPPAVGAIGPGGYAVSISLYPYGFIAWLVLLVPMSKIDRLKSVVSAIFLSIPYAPIYSLIMVLVLPVHWLAYIPLYLPYIFGQSSFYLGALTPIIVIAFVLAKNLKPAMIMNKIRKS